MQVLILPSGTQQPLHGACTLLGPHYCRCDAVDTFFTGVFVFGPFSVCLVTKWPFGHVTPCSCTPAQAYLTLVTGLPSAPRFPNEDAEVPFVAGTPEVNASPRAVPEVSFPSCPWRAFKLAEGRGDLLGGAQPFRGEGSMLWGTLQPLRGRGRGNGAVRWEPCRPLRARENGGRCHEEGPALSVSACQGRAAPCDWLFSPRGRVRGHRQPMGSVRHLAPLQRGSEMAAVLFPSAAIAAVALSLFLLQIPVLPPLSCSLFYPRFSEECPPSAPIFALYVY